MTIRIIQNSNAGGIRWPENSTFAEALDKAQAVFDTNGISPADAHAEMWKAAEGQAHSVRIAGVWDEAEAAAMKVIESDWIEKSALDYFSLGLAL